jgi:phosphoribosylanthranilate isomerase
MTWIKICGTTSLHDAQMSIAAGADALGFIFASSPRRIAVEDAAAITSWLPAEVETIGVFVNESPAHVAGIVRQAGLTGVQLHGDETAEQMPEFRAALRECKLIKTLQARDILSAGREKFFRYLWADDAVDAILLDSGSATEQRGGTGTPFAWKDALDLAEAIRSRIPLIVAGGLTAENVGTAIEILQPNGVDVVSGVECAPGKKDEAKLREFIAAVRKLDQSTEFRGISHGAAPL